MADGNIATMREAIVIIRDMLINGGHDAQCRAKIVTICNTVLSTPTRNCDVGTAEEQEKRFDSFCCANYKPNNVDAECWGCPLMSHRNKCEFAWAQLPYEAEGGQK